MRLLIVILVASGCCIPSGEQPEAPGTSVRPAEPEPAAEVVEPEPAEPEVSPDPPNSIRRVNHIANFANDQLTHCADMELFAVPPDPLPERWPPAELELEEGQMRVQRPCAESFPDRTSLGTCTARIENSPETGGHAVMSIVEYWYTADAVLDDDRLMRECLEMGGSWEAIDRDSAAAQQARLQQARRELEALRNRRR